MAKQAVIVGGGFAGLTAGVALADAGWQVTVLERHASLGGRARSFTDPATGDIIDNGQHVFLSCYDHTLRFLTRLGTADRLVFQDRLEVAFAEPGRRLAVLRCPKLPAPWHVGVGLLGLSNLSWADKLAMWRVWTAVGRRVADGAGTLDRMTVAAWLASLGQSARSRQVFWDPLAIAALNEAPTQASALGFATVLARMFGTDWRASRLGLASVGLSDLYTVAASHVIAAAGGSIRLNTAVAAMEGDGGGGRASGVRLASGERLIADAYVSAVPPRDLVRLLPGSLLDQDAAVAQARRFSSSPIVSINLWLDRAITDQPFVGFIGTRVQWLFNRPRLITPTHSARHVALVISAAAAFLAWSNEALVTMALDDLRACLPSARDAQLIRAQVVREHHATINTPRGSHAWRPGPTTTWENLFLAGDWTATGLPATIESAVASGYAAADCLLLRPRRGATRRP